MGRKFKGDLEGLIYIWVCFRCRLLKYYILVEICRNGDEELLS